MRNKTRLLSIMAAAAVVISSAGITAYAADELPAMSDAQTPPDKPDGEAAGGAPDGEPPARPDGEEQGTPPEKPDGESGQGGGPGGAPGGMGGGSAVTEWSAVTEYSSDTSTSGQSYSSTGTDENAVHISGGSVVLDNAAVTRTSSDSTGGDSSSFYGVGAAVLATGGTAYINGGTIDTDSKGGAGAFAYSDGVVYIKDTVINTKQSTSGGIHAAGGGTLYAWDVTAETNGESSAAIRSDRGGGTMVIDGGTYTSNGTGSPAVYCTADISVNDAQLQATNSEGICIEGLNSLHIYDSDLIADMPETAQNENLTWTVIVYQSMSGDSQVGNSDFYYEGGSILTTSDILLYTTNTESHITLNDVDINGGDDIVILRATGNANGRGWGSTGKNGADCTFTAIAQDLDGDIIYDSISNVDVYLTEGSYLYGAVIDDESDAGDGGNGACSIYIDSTSDWCPTGDCTVTNLYNAGSIEDVDNKTVTIKDAKGNVLVEGDSEYTITVTGTYSTEADLSGAAADQDFTAVTLPAQFGAASADVSGDIYEDTEDETVPDDNTAAVQDSTAAETAEKQPSPVVNDVKTSADANPRTGAVTAISAFIASFGIAGAAYAAKRRKK
ncbi:MAG: hypothetical protein IK990_12140 [Ruminiclostridium sp.]|nr:hypothetical protein [Ruminiclostridium sp.]